jgi:hypothetical protein
VSPNADDPLTLPSTAVTDRNLELLNEDYAQEIISWANEGKREDEGGRSSVFKKLFSFGKKSSEDDKRRKAQKEAKEAALRVSASGRDTASAATIGWPQRYGAEVTDQEWSAITAVVRELEVLQEQLRNDKAALQVRIVAASEACSEAREALADARARVEKLSLTTPGTTAASFTNALEKLMLSAKRSHSTNKDLQVISDLLKITHSLKHSPTQTLTHSLTHSLTHTLSHLR